MNGMDEMQRLINESMKDGGHARRLEAGAAALLILVEYGIPPDVQQLLVNGSKREGVRPGALVAALSAALGVYNRLS